VKSDVLGNEVSYKKSKDELKKIHKRQVKLKKDIDKVTDSIVNFETSMLIGKRDKIEIRKIVKNLEKHRLGLQSELEEVTNSLIQEQEQTKWVDWIKEFGVRIKKLQESSFTIEEKKRFLEGILEKIEIDHNSSSGEHEVVLKFRLPYVGDVFKYNDPADKSKGYTIKRGRKSTKIVTDLSKKKHDGSNKKTQ
jgi:hypothetical protein